MKDILVCVKQVPNTERVSLDRKDHTLIREGIKNILNPADENALVAASILKEKYGINFGVITMGPLQAVEVLEYCLSKGANEAFLLNDKRLAGSDTLATAKALTSFIKKSGYRNIFCGQESADSGTAHIGPSIAQLLNLPQVTNVLKILVFGEDKLKVKTKYESEFRVIEAKMPVVVTFLKEPVKFKKKPFAIDRNLIQKINLDKLGMDESEVGLNGSFTWVVNIDIDEEILDYIKVDNSLAADDKIMYLLSGGIEENENRTIITDLSKNSLKKVVGIIKDNI
jgi:electron transfer flavoprotein beta subunit